MLHDEANGAVPQRERVYAFRNFVLKTFARDLLTGAVLDVAGGKGDLSWLLTNADGAKAVVVDPRTTDHTKILRTALWHLENNEKDEASLRELRGPQGPLRSLRLSPPFKVPEHLRIYLDAELVAEVERESKHDPTSVPSESWLQFWAQASARAEDTAPCGHHQDPKLERHALPRASRIEDATAALRVLQSTRLILGFHPDEATEACIDLALQLKVPFAVCPCCVFPKVFPERQLYGHKVKTYPDFLVYLQHKHPRMRRAELRFEAEGGYARGTVLFLLPGDLSQAEDLQDEPMCHACEGGA